MLPTHEKAAPTNPWEVNARTRKAKAIASHLWDHLDADMRRAPGLPVVLEGLSQEERDLLAENAGQRTPSETTWAEVICEIAYLHERFTRRAVPA